MQTPVTHRCLGPRHFLEMLTHRLCIIRVPVAHRFWTLWLTGGPGCRVIPAPDTRNATKPHSRSPKLARGGRRSLPTRKRPRGFVHRGPAGGGGGLASLCLSPGRRGGLGAGVPSAIWPSAAPVSARPAGAAPAGAAAWPAPRCGPGSSWRGRLETGRQKREGRHRLATRGRAACVPKGGP